MWRWEYKELYRYVYHVFAFCNQTNSVESNYFFFVETDLTSLIGDRPLANSCDTNTSLYSAANAHFNVVSGLEEKEKSVDDRNKRAITLDANSEALANSKSEKSSGIDDNSDDEIRGPNSKEVQIAKERKSFSCQSTTAGLFKKYVCQLPQNFFMLSLSNIFHVWYHLNLLIRISYQRTPLRVHFHCLCTLTQYALFKNCLSQSLWDNYPLHPAPKLLHQKNK